MERRLYRSATSIGSQCLTSVAMQAADIKRFSGPFDWIFSNLRMVCDCIEDDFSMFLDRSQYVRIEPERRSNPDGQFAHHIHYGRRYGLHALFNHSDPTQPEVYAYLERCVDRFRQMLRSPEPQLLLAVSTREQGGRYAFDRLSKILASYPKVEACVIILQDFGCTQALEIWEEHDRHRLFNLRSLSPIAGIHFENASDNAYLTQLLRGMIALSSS